MSSLTKDKAKNFYGTTLAGGTVGQGTIFELSPQSDGTYAETILFNFCANYVGQPCLDGYQPSSLIADGAGNLYGTNYMGGPPCQTGTGDCGGTVFELSPPQSLGQPWTYQVLYNFCSVIGGEICLDGSNPHSQLVLDASGNLYGTTTKGGSGHLVDDFGAGVVFELSPNIVGWTETILYNFCSLGENFTCPDGALPQAGVTFDKSGNLYGTTELSGWTKAGHGLIYEISPSSTGWQQTVLLAFAGPKSVAPLGKVSFDAAGNLYTTTSGGNSTYGSIVRLTSPGGYRSVFFDGSNGSEPAAGVLVNPENRNLYGTTTGNLARTYGNVFQVSSRGAITSLYDFCSLPNCTDGASPQAGVIGDTSGQLYGTTEYGGTNNQGVVFEINP
jgi:uncharacterized repeat protein (TIGR03803 family)